MGRLPIRIALLRGVNVGGAAKLPMKAFRDACAEAGLVDVESYIASGNLVFGGAASRGAAADIITGVLRDRFGLTKNPVFVRDADEIAAAMARNPFMDAARERPNLMLIHFLQSTPKDDAVAKLAGLATVERLHLDGDVLFIDFAGGVGRSKLTPAVLDKALGAPFTARNWNTCGKLVAMARAREAGARGDCRSATGDPC